MWHFVQDHSGYVEEDCENKYDCGTWTGANDISVEDSFVWIGSNTPVTFTNWTGANPDDDMVTKDLDCVEIFYDSTWNDRPCPHLKPFICEK
uniref:C-type lectin domain-containing protein n=1 Tax=Magallana gigas TaxID=29159 RepID=A0A8W8NLT5_MAGGI